jgi:folate-dependent tRNA-U54 methylase TrmFO/GidA
MPGAPYAPTNVNYGLLPPLPDARKDNRKARMAERARADFDAWLGACHTSAA